MPVHPHFEPRPHEPHERRPRSRDRYSLKDRARRLDEGVELILRALSGEAFTTPDGRPVFVRPLPVRKPQDILMIGGGVAASARRAARFGLGFNPLLGGLDPELSWECLELVKEVLPRLG